MKTEKAIFASGCFWGTQYIFQNEKGVVKTTVGYIGGNVENPTYDMVCSGTTGHVEAIEIEYNPKLVSYEKLVRLFFETHNPTQTNGQGPDIGSQYMSKIFYFNESQKKVAEKLIKKLEEKGMQIATKIEKAKPFYKAEEYHQNYYQKIGKTPYCHVYKKLF